MKYGTICCIDSAEGILMIRKFDNRNGDPNSGYCTLPGGKLEAYEKGLGSIEGRVSSTIRETEDETGIKPLNPVFIGTVLFDNKDRKFTNWPNPDNFLVSVFYTKDYSGELKEKSDEGVPFWAKDWKEVDSLPSNPGDRLLYQWIREKKNFFGVIKHKEEEIDESGSWFDFF